MTKGYRYCLRRAGWRFLTSLVLAVVGSMVIASPALALDLNPFDYFQIEYDPITLDKTDIHGSESFNATISGRAVCSRDLPVSPTKAIMTSRIIARHNTSGTAVILNSSYMVTIEPFPDKQGDVIEMSKSVPLRFPSGAPSGDYDIIGEILDASIITKVMFAEVSIPVTGFLPGEESIGTVTYTAPESESAPEPVAEIIPEPSEPSASPPPITDNPLPAAEPEPESVVPWWIQVVFLLAIATTAVNVVWFVRRRRK